MSLRHTVSLPAFLIHVCAWFRVQCVGCCLGFRVEGLGCSLGFRRFTPYQSLVSLTALTMGWLRLVRSIKLQVSFAKEPYKRDNILPKRPII